MATTIIPHKEKPHYLPTPTITEKQMLDIILMLSHDDFNDRDVRLMQVMEEENSDRTTLANDLQRIQDDELHQRDDDIAYEENAQTERIIEAFEHLGSSDEDDFDYCSTPYDEGTALMEDELQSSQRASMVDDSDGELTPAELLDCIMHDTDMYMVDYHGDACDVLLAQPRFILLRQTAYTSLVLFPDGKHGIFITDDIVTARLQAHLAPTASTHDPDLLALAISYCAAALH
jgi:hypothetical protein